nr:serine/threonine protein kinase [Deltaproteobacteria bacterium]
MGTIVGEKYRIERIVASGGMGTVYAAMNSWTQRPVALKFPLARRGDRGTLSDTAVERFLREARAASRIEHPNVVTVFDLGRDRDGEVFLVQELLDGETLAQRLTHDGPLSLETARALLLPAMDALCEAHRQGVVHRDLKPENLFIARSPERAEVLKVLDFGIAWLDDADPDDRLTRTGSSVGTPAFMSPEQCRGAADIDARSDVWAVALIWAEALSGRRVLAAPSANETIARVLTERVTLRLPEVPAPLVAVLQRGVEALREDRWPTLRAFADALEAASAPSPAPHSAAAHPHRRLASALIALALLVLFGVSVSFARRTPARPSPGPAPSNPVAVSVSSPAPGAAPALPPAVTMEPRSVLVDAPFVLPVERPLSRGASRAPLRPRVPLPPPSTAVGVNRAPILEP